MTTGFPLARLVPDREVVSMGTKVVGTDYSKRKHIVGARLLTECRVARVRHSASAAIGNIGNSTTAANRAARFKRKTSFISGSPCLLVVCEYRMPSAPVGPTRRTVEFFRVASPS